MRQTLVLLVAMALPSLGPDSANLAAQSPSSEFGIDASYMVSFPDGGDRLSTFEIPFGRVRVGTYVDRHWLFEVGAGFALASESGRSASTGRGDLGLSYHFGSDASRTRFFLLGGGGGRWATADDRTVGQAFATGGAGVKVPINRVVGMRIEADYSRAFGTTDLSAAHEIRGLLGMSFFVGS